MTSNEMKRTIAKLVLVISTILLVAAVMNLLFPDVLSSILMPTGPSSPKDLDSAYDQLKKQYNDRNDKINEANENAKKLNDKTSILKSYADKNIQKYAIGGGLSIILGLWISTIILYIKESRGLFKG